MPTPQDGGPGSDPNTDTDQGADTGPGSASTPDPEPAGDPVEPVTVRTASGECVVGGGEVRVDTGPVMRARRYLEGGPAPLAVLAGVCALCLLFVLSGDTTSQLIVLAVVGLGTLRFFLAGVAAEGPVSIPVGAIERVEADPGGWGRNPTLYVHHHRGGETRVRTVTLPPKWYGYSETAYRTAVEAFRTRGVRVEEGERTGDRRGVAVES